MCLLSISRSWMRYGSGTVVPPHAVVDGRRGSSAAACALRRLQRRCRYLHPLRADAGTTGTSWCGPVRFRTAVERRSSRFTRVQRQSTPTSLTVCADDARKGGTPAPEGARHVLLKIASTERSRLRVTAATTTPRVKQAPVRHQLVRSGTGAAVQSHQSSSLSHTSGNTEATGKTHAMPIPSRRSDSNASPNQISIERTKTIPNDAPAATASTTKESIQAAVTVASVRFVLMRK